MRFQTLVLTGLVLGLVSACASTPDPAPRHTSASAATAQGAQPGQRPWRRSAGPAPDPLDATHLIADSSDHQKVGNTYVVAGRTYRPERDDRYDRVGIASWYGPNFHGRLTANGEIFDQDAMTAAHTTLPIPSIAEVTNLENGRSVIVRVNDRGPFVDDRIIDMSRAAATELGFIGVGLAEVRVRYLGPAHATGAAPERIYRASREPGAADVTPPPIAMAAVEPLAGIPQNAAYDSPLGQSVTLQVGAFSDAANADRFAARLADAGDVWIEPATSAIGTVYRVYFGRWQDRRQAFAAQSDLVTRGVHDSRIIALD
ncbi:septal ring lytic transglycosylase RlpA family protein [Maricaulis sp. CAU 1757]